MSENKPGVYLCEGCGIAEAVSVDELEQMVTGELRVPVCKRHAALCSEEGVALIAEDVKAGEVTRAIIAACSPRVMADKFTFDGAMTVRANLREQVAWALPAGEEDTQMMAADNIRMAVAQAAKIEPPVPHWDGAVSKKLLVVGGGVSGLTAALEAAKTGVEVVLVEKSGELGGWAAKFSKTIPHRPPYRGLQETGVADLIQEVTNHPAITVKTDTIVAKTAGMPGKFEVELKNGAGSAEDVFGAIVVATGWRPLDVSHLKHLGLGVADDVITDVQFEELAAAGKIARKSDGKAPSIVAFIVSGDEERMPYSSGVASKVAIKQALQVVEADPDAMVYIIYEELRTHGTAEEFYREAQEKGIIFQKGKVKSVGPDLTVTVEDELLGEEVPMQGIELVVVSTGMVPNSTNIDLPPVEKGAALLADDIDPKAPLFNVNGKPVEEADKSAASEGNGEDETEEPPLPGGPILNLQYRQGPHLPILANGFADSHYICFPYETRRTGIYTCGPVRRPMTIAEAREDAMGAVLKAIQAMEAADAARAVHPRVGDLSYPEFGLDMCTKCRRCTVECPFGAIDEDPETDYPVLNPTRCRRCGTCMGACPVRTITFKNYNPQMVSDMIGAVHIPDEFSGKPRILVLACENDAYPALDMAGINRRELNPYMRFIPVRCLGSVTLLWISTALEKGYDGVMLMGCKSGDDYQCHFVKGSAMAQERMSKVGETLKSLMLEEERVQVEEVSIADSQRITDILSRFGKQIEDMGLNPFKGF